MMRLLVYDTVRSGRHTSREVHEALGISQSLATYHLRVLHDVGLLDREVAQSSKRVPVYRYRLVAS